MNFTKSKQTIESLDVFAYFVLHFFLTNLNSLTFAASYPNFMKRLINIVCSGLTFLFLIACGSSQKIITQKPNPENVTEEIVEKETSFLSLPIEIALQDIQNQVNKSMTGLLFNDEDFSDDQVKIKVWKDGVIQFSQEKNQIKIQVPIRSEGTYA